MDKKRYELNVQLAQMLKGGVIMDVTNVEQAKIAEEAGAVAVMALERVPSDIRRDGGVARMSDPELIEGIQAAVTIPVMAKARIGHFAEAQVLETSRLELAWRWQFHLARLKLDRVLGTPLSEGLAMPTRTP